MLALIWGSSFILIKKGLGHFQAGQVGAYRIAVAYVALLPIALRGLSSIPLDRWPFLAVSGFLGNLFPAWLFAIAQTKLDSSVTGILNTLTPLFTFIISLLFFGRPARFTQVVGLGLGFFGAAGLSFVSAGGQIGTFNHYALLIALATLCYGFSINTIASKLQALPSVLISAAGIFTVGPVAVAYLAATGFHHQIAISTASWGAFGYLTLLGLMGTAVGLVMFNKLVKISSPVFASSVTYVIPLFALGWGLLDGEQPTWLHLGGLTLILAGVYAINRGR
jgi:drug/metabolite transporter (DMT)-like permease